jgi:hypothetical protein
MTDDGGAVATYGFRRQFLATAEEILQLIVESVENLTELAVVIEPTRVQLQGTDVADDDIVDFAIEKAHEIVRRVQVKSTRAPSGMNPLRYSAAAAIFKRMGTGAQEAVILTNKPLAKKLRESCATPSTAANDSAVVYTVTARAITSRQPHTPRLIVREDRTAEELKHSVIDLVRKIRRDNATGLGEQSAAMITSMLLDRVFEAAADLTPRRWTATEIVDLICTPENQIAHARREHDWGYIKLYDAEATELTAAGARELAAALVSAADIYDGVP